ncbi:hypothetical protein D1F64_07870 [Breoghania sp. L-A4]|nr:hypothetical protein D1F64_07870 [Breoghania sp. L-A4]
MIVLPGWITRLLAHHIAIFTPAAPYPIVAFFQWLEAIARTVARNQPRPILPLGMNCRAGTDRPPG